MTEERIRLPLILACGIAAVSSASILIRFARAEQIPPLIIAASRLGLASMILIPLAWTRRRDELFSLARGQISLAIVSGVFLALHFAFWVSSLDYTSVMSSVVFVATNPLFVAAASVIILRESVAVSIWIGIAIAVLGGFLIGGADLETGVGSVRGDLLALGGAVAAAAYVLIGRRLRASLSLTTYVAIVYGVATVILLIAAVLGGETFAGYSAYGYLLLILLALGPQLIGHTSFNYALGYLSAAIVSVILLAEPVGATALAVPLLGELPSPPKLIGGALVLVGIGVAALGRSPAADSSAGATGPGGAQRRTASGQVD